MKWKHVEGGEYMRYCGDDVLVFEAGVEPTSRAHGCLSFRLSIRATLRGGTMNENVFFEDVGDAKKHAKKALKFYRRFESKRKSKS